MYKSVFGLRNWFVDSKKIIMYEFIRIIFELKEFSLFFIVLFFLGLNYNIIVID